MKDKEKIKEKVFYRCPRHNISDYKCCKRGRKIMKKNGDELIRKYLGLTKRQFKSLQKGNFEKRLEKIENAIRALATAIRGNNKYGLEFSEEFNEELLRIAKEGRLK